MERVCCRCFGLGWGVGVNPSLTPEGPSTQMRCSLNSPKANHMGFRVEGLEGPSNQWLGTEWILYCSSSMLSPKNCTVASIFFSVPSFPTSHQ